MQRASSSIRKAKSPLWAESAILHRYRFNVITMAVIA